MRFFFLGGADEVGASCTLLEVAGKRLLIDAGMRMQKRSGSQLPDLSMLDGKPIDVILLTHAHTDHIGALPLVHLGNPRSPIITTAPTRDLTRVLLQDSLKIMESRWEQEEEIPLFPAHAVEGMLSRMTTVGCGHKVPLLDGSITATFIPSGHILGACSITLETPEGRILFAGDFSVDRQQTVDGMTIPSGPPPHVMITESTYGNRFHANRRAEEDRLIKSIVEVVEAKGKVLIPAFALGRAQEVLLLLLNAQRRGHIPPFPVYADGMVRTMSMVYSGHPDYLRDDLRKRIASDGNPFFYAGGAERVMNPRERDKVVLGPPCVVVASSGMLTGGPSRMYAERFADNPKNAIFITGYQDEESPGHQLLELAREVEETGSGLLRLEGQTRRVRCQVKRYGLSAHADASQILNVVCRLQPEHVVLVHGDPDARSTLSTTFPPTMKVHTPSNSAMLEFASFYRTAPRVGAAVTAGLGCDSKELDLALLHAGLIKRDGFGRRYTVGELAQAWFGRPDPEQTETLERAVANAPSVFAPDPHRPFLFTPVAAPRAKPAHAPKPAKKIESESATAMRVARSILGDLRSFENVSFNPEEQQITLFFTFPERAMAAYRDRIARISAQTGFSVIVSPRCSNRSLTDAVREVVPLIWDVSKVSIYPTDGRIVARLKTQLEPAAGEFSAIIERYRELTGRGLELESVEPLPAPQTLFDEHGRMEQNAAFNLIKQRFAALGFPVIHCGRKTSTSVPHLELSFISPTVGDQNAELLSELSRETGWELHYRKEPHVQSLALRSRQLLPLHWCLVGEPKVLKAESLVMVKLESEPEQDACNTVSLQLERETGFRLALAP